MQVQVISTSIGAVRMRESVQVPGAAGVQYCTVQYVYVGVFLSPDLAQPPDRHRVAPIMFIFESFLSVTRDQ